MTNFKYRFYHILFEKQKNSFEVIFDEIKAQLNIYHRQFELTLKSYKKEWQDEIDRINVVYKEEKEKADQIYEKVFNENSNTDYGHSFAMNQSGLDYLIEQHYTNLENINKEYKDFLDLYSKSILIALYSLNESKLNEICENATKAFSKKIKPSHFNSRDYLNASFQYLNLVIDIDTTKLEKYVSKIKDLQFLRNSIVHNEAKFSDANSVTKIVKKHKTVLSLNNKNHLQITGAEFIKNVFDLFLEFYETLFWLIDEKQESKIIKIGLKHWLGQIDKEISIENFKISDPIQTEKKISFKAVSKKEEIPQFECKISFKKANDNSFSYTNQTENEALEWLLNNEKEVKGLYMCDIFTPLFFLDKFNIKVMVS